MYTLRGEVAMTEISSPKRGQHRQCSLPLVGVTTQMPRAGVCQSVAAGLSSIEHAGLEGP